MIDYAAVFTNFLGAFPNITGVNSSGPATTDGTEYIKAFVDDIWGRFQAILDYAALTPNGVTEAAGASQHIDALKKGFGIGPGIGVTWWKSADPSVTGDRVLLLNGQGILRANYVDLDAEVYVGDANNTAVAAAGGGFFRADNSDGTSPNIAGIYLIMPDSRGVTFRGLDAAASIDPDGASRYKGDLQLDAMQRITGSLFAVWTRISIKTGVYSATSSAGGSSASGAAQEASSVIFDSTNSVSPNAAKTDDIESRMVNISTQYGITY